MEPPTHHRPPKISWRLRFRIGLMLMVIETSNIQR